MFDKWPIRSAACVFALALTGLSPQQFETADQIDLTWASHLISAAVLQDQPTVYAWAHDFLGKPPRSSKQSYTHRIADAGTGITTAGSGSLWLYDPVHHIAAFSDGGGDAVAYARPPRGHIKTRDLSHIVSLRGLRLGLTSADVVRILGVTPRAVRRLSAVRSELYLRTNEPCAPYMCAHDEAFTFDRDRAVSIFLADLGP